MHAHLQIEACNSKNRGCSFSQKQLEALSKGRLLHGDANSSPMRSCKVHKMSQVCGSPKKLLTLPVLMHVLRQACLL